MPLNRLGLPTFGAFAPASATRQTAPRAWNCLKRSDATNWRARWLSGDCWMVPLCLSLALLVLAVPSHAQAPATAITSKYYPTYEYYVTKSPFWRTVSKMGQQPVMDGLGIWNASGTFGAGIVSESMGYAMMLAALYNDQPTFDRLSKTVQAGINSTGLFPWYWHPEE